MLDSLPPNRRRDVEDEIALHLSHIAGNPSDPAAFQIERWTTAVLDERGDDDLLRGKVIFDGSEYHVFVYLGLLDDYREGRAARQVCVPSGGTPATVNGILEGTAVQLWAEVDGWRYVPREPHHLSDLPGYSFVHRDDLTTGDDIVATATSLPAYWYQEHYSFAVPRSLTMHMAQVEGCVFESLGPEDKQRVIESLLREGSETNMAWTTAESLLDRMRPEMMYQPIKLISEEAFREFAAREPEEARVPPLFGRLCPYSSLFFKAYSTIREVDDVSTIQRIVAQYGHGRRETYADKFDTLPSVLINELDGKLTERARSDLEALGGWERLCQDEKRRFEASFADD